MTLHRKRSAGFIAALATFSLTATGAIALENDDAPSDAEALAIDYVEGRLENPRGARVRVDGEPYKVYADFDEYEDVPAWAVDVKARMRLKSGTGSAPYTVIFVDGEPVAIEDDGVDLAMR